MNHAEHSLKLDTTWLKLSTHNSVTLTLLQGTLSALADRFQIHAGDKFPTVALSPQVYNATVALSPQVYNAPVALSPRYTMQP